MVLGMTFFSLQFTFSNFYLDYFSPFLFGLFFPLNSFFIRFKFVSNSFQIHFKFVLNSFQIRFYSIAVTFWISSKFFSLEKLTQKKFLLIICMWNSRSLYDDYQKCIYFFPEILTSGVCLVSFQWYAVYVPSW